MKLLMDNILQERFGTWKILGRIRIFEIGIEPFPIIAKKEPLVFLTFWFLAQGL